MGYNDDMDGFWDIEKLVPKKKPIRPFSAGVRAAQITVDSDSEPSSPSERRLSFSDMKSTADTPAPTDREYSPEGNPFIRRVRIKHSLDRYDFYGNFRKAALVYYDYKTPRCDYVPFYSYMPQYSQLSAEQKNYYFYWRDELRHGRYARTDCSYIYLYAFEILNLPDKIPPKEGLRLLCDVWRSYRTVTPRIDADFSLWVQDYCLVWGLEAPIGYISDFLPQVIALSPIKEFYFSAEAATSPEHRATLLSCLSDYDWRKVKYATGDSSQLYSRHMRAAMSSVISDMWYGGEINRSLTSTELVKRPAFARSICTHSVKCNLEIEYSPSSASTLREKVTAAVRYCENKLRALMGVKSRLAVKDMDPYYAHIIDKYFESVYKIEGERRRVEATPAYERLYDAPSGTLSFGGAKEIEQGSWQTTARLIAEDDMCDDEIVAIEAPTAEIQQDRVEITAEKPEAVSGAPLGKGELEMLIASLNGRSPAQSLEADALADRINEALYDEIGDIVIEAGDDGYTIIEDYREDLERLINYD